MNEAGSQLSLQPTPTFLKSFPQLLARLSRQSVLLFCYFHLIYIFETRVGQNLIILDSDRKRPHELNFKFHFPLKLPLKNLISHASYLSILVMGRVPKTRVPGGSG